jgi:two-component system, chemotaxis family, CheB/CheR fusion protein
MPEQPKATLDALLEFVKETRGFDFTGYKRASLERRLTKRMGDVNVSTYDEYIDYLQLHAEEFAELFNTILINVTSFFRDPPAWSYLAEEVVPQLVSGAGADRPLRVWCAGCASGEEPYTVAMIIATVIGEDAFNERVKIYATDVDEEALDQARSGAYVPRQIEDVPRDALERFFERTDQRYLFRKDLRRCVIFGRNDLVQDAPISHIDLLVCRNTLMYFTTEAQAQILRRFHFGLEDDGFLLLGKSEMLVTHSDLFTPVDMKRRVFRKVIKPALRDRVRAMALDPANGAGQSVAEDLREAAYDIVGYANLVLDASGSVVMANDAARRLFGLRPSDFGRPVQDLELSYRPVELRGHLDLLVRELHTIDIRAVRWHRDDRDFMFDVRLTPLLGDGVHLGTSITYLDVTDAQNQQSLLSASKRELEQAYEELQATVEELETTNEELQSTNEELETTNEELQSTNEELETMNEELQSGNEELETMNDELRHRTGELNDVNTFLETILATIGMAVAVVDRQQRVQIWNDQARDLWGVTAEEAEDQHLLALDIGLPLDTLKPALRSVLNSSSDREEVLLHSTNRRGKGFDCRVTCLPLGAGRTDGAVGAIVLMEPVDA